MLRRVFRCIGLSCSLRHAPPQAKPDSTRWSATRRSSEVSASPAPQAPTTATISSPGPATTRKAQLIWWPTSSCSPHRPAESFGFLATNTIAQGDTSEVGLTQIIDNDWTIHRAVPSSPWPGDTIPGDRQSMGHPQTVARIAAARRTPRRRDRRDAVRSVRVGLAQTAARRQQGPIVHRLLSCSGLTDSP